MSVLLLACRNLARNRRRTLLTGGIVVFGFAAFALAGGFMAQSLEGLREGTIRSGLGHLQLAHPAQFEGVSGETLEHTLELTDEVQRILRSAPEVVEVLPRIEFVGLVTSGSRSLPYLGVGLDPQPEARIMDHPKILSAGRWLADVSEQAVVLGTGLAGALSVQVGDTVTLLATTGDGTLNAVDASVVGLAAVPFKELDDRFLATSLELAGTLLALSGRVSKIVVVLDDPDAAPVVLQRLLAQFQDAGIELTGKTWEELALFYRQVRLLYLAIFGFMGAVLVTVVLLAATNTMLMAVVERTREVGTLRALGTRPATIRRMFVTEGALLAAAGCAAGMALSLLVCAILNQSGIMLPPPPGATHGSPLHVKFYGIAYAAGAVAMLGTMVFASYFPARRASRMSIVEALTHV